MSKTIANQDHVDHAIDAIDGAAEVYVHKDYFDSLKKQTGSATPGPQDSPVVEKALGSTRQIGQYNDLPVYSHGKDPDKVFVNGSGGSQPERSKGWFKDGKITTAP